VSVLCTAPVYLSAAGTPAPATAQAGGFWSRIFGIGNPPGYQGPLASAASSAASLPSTTSPPTTSTTTPPPPPPPLREVIVVVPDSLFQSFTDQLRTVGLAVERPHG
jgi:hypothetical protein